MRLPFPPLLDTFKEVVAKWSDLEMKYFRSKVSSMKCFE